MSHPDRLTALDSSFLHLEDAGSSHMHVASVLVFDGEAPTYPELLGHIEDRLHLVPRFRQRLAEVPFGAGRPVWVDDPHFNLRYHVRHTALPRPGGEDQLKRLAGRLFAQRLDRSKPLWEIWLVERLDAGERFALIAKTHHALVDGVSGVDVTAVLFDSAPDATPLPVPAKRWMPQPLPSGAELLTRALVERTVEPGEIARSVRRLSRAPRAAIGNIVGGFTGVGSLVRAMAGAPPSPLNVEIGPHRRYTWVDADLAEFRAIKDRLGGTVNDVVLAAVAGGLGRFLRERGDETAGLTLRAMVPVSVRAETEHGALGNRVSAVYAPLPVDVEDPVAQFTEIRDAMAGLKESGQAVGAQLITELAGFAPPTILAQAARLQHRQRFFNLVVTNVPGPQFTLYCLGRPMRRLYPVVPLANCQALGIAIMSYDGHLGFGLLSDYDALPDLEELATALEAAIQALAEVAGVAPAGPREGRGRAGRGRRAGGKTAGRA